LTREKTKKGVGVFVVFFLGIASIPLVWGTWILTKEFIPDIDGVEFAFALVTLVIVFFAVIGAVKVFLDLPPE